MKRIIVFLAAFALLSALSCAAPVWSPEAQADFTILQPGSFLCVKDDVSSAWIDESNPNGAASFNDCYRDTGYPSTGCCPDNIDCDRENPVEGKFLCSGVSPDFCSGYETQPACEAFNYETAKRTVESGKEAGFCGSKRSDFIETYGTCWWDIFDCRCTWNGAADGGNGACESAFNETSKICDGGNIPAGSCSLSNLQKTGDCSTETYFVYSWTASWNDGTAAAPYVCAADDEACPPDCRSGEKTLPCLDLQQLAFYSTLTLAVIILAIIVFYVLSRKKSGTEVKDKSVKRKMKNGRRKRK